MNTIYRKQVITKYDSIIYILICVVYIISSLILTENLTKRYLSIDLPNIVVGSSYLQGHSSLKQSAINQNMDYMKKQNDPSDDLVEFFVNHYNF